MIGSTISHYKIIEELGRGGMGVVYKAQDTKLNRLVALKFLPEEFTRNAQARERFVNEARAASALDHPNICTIYEIRETPEGQSFIAMSYYDGETLSDRIRHGLMGINDIIGIALQLADGLQAAHDHGIVHRDIKSSNALLTAKDQVKILDFGLARRSDQTTLTKTGATAGTVPYMSPEQARGENIDHRTDIWSFGVVLYEMIAGRLPFESPYSEAIVYSILNQDPPSIASLRNDVPAELEQIVTKALQKEPPNRYQSIAELRARLTALQKQLASGEDVELAKVRTSKKRLQVFGAATLLIALLVSALVYFYPGKAGATDSIAVLPLENLSADPEQQYLADGVHEALTTDLAKLSGLRRVIARSSTRRYQHSDKPLPQIAKELRVAALMTGSVQRVGERVQVTVQLINAETEEQLWADRYERDMLDVLSLQNDIVAEISRQIKIQLTPREEARLAQARKVNPEAYEAYLRGKFELNKFTREGFEKGLAYLHQAVEIDPAEPFAYAALALGYSLIGHESLPDKFARAKAAAVQALELDPMHPEALEALAEIQLYRDWDFPGAGEAFRQVIDLNPNLAEPHAHFAWYHLLYDRNDEAYAEALRAQELDPLTPLWTAWRGWIYWWTGEFERAKEEARKAIEIDPNFPWGLYVLGGVLAEQEKYQEAFEVHQKLADDNPRLGWALGYTYALAGRRDEALRIAATQEQKPAPITTWGLALIYTALGDKDNAFRWLEEGFKLRFSWMPWIRQEPGFKPLHDDPRFKEMERRLKVPGQSTTVNKGVAQFAWK